MKIIFAGGGTAGHVDQVGGDVNAEALRDLLCDHGADLCVTLRRGVAVKHHGILGFKHAYKILIDLLGRGNTRISERKIKDVFLADLRLSLFSVFKKLTYNRPFST